MLAIRKWNPFRELSTMHEEMDEFFKKTLGAMGGLTRGFFAESWYPAMESFVREGNLVVHAEIPGIDPKDIDISIFCNLLNEVCYGSFERTLTLPEGVKADNIHASYTNGILEITMPAEKAALPRKVTIDIEGGGEKIKKAA